MFDLNTFNFYNLEEYVQQKGIQHTEWRYIKDILNTKVSMFRYEGLPEGLTTEIIERDLMFRNRLCLYKSIPLGKIVVCKYVPCGLFDENWKPTKVDLIAINGATIAQNVPFEDVVLLRDNTMDIIPFICIDEYIDRINSIEKTIEVMSVVLRLPLLFTGDKAQVATLKATMKKVLNFEPVAIADKQLKECLTQFDIKVPYSPLDLYELKMKYRNECLSSLGIYYVDVKRERIVTAEIISQNDFVDYIYQDAKNERERAVREMNEKWGCKAKLIEVYTENREEDIEIKAKEASLIAKAESDGDKDGKNVR
jgi:hypothetical protein